MNINDLIYHRQPPLSRNGFEVIVSPQEVVYFLNIPLRPHRLEKPPPELEEEKDELRGYQEKDKERRCLEYAFYHREQVALANALDEIEDFRQGGIEGTDENREAFMDGERAIAELEVEIGQLNRQLAGHEARHQHLHRRHVLFRHQRFRSSAGIRLP